MLDFKKKVSAVIADAATGLFPDCGLDAVTVFDMLEYPPDSTMGDVALPCFKLSRTLRAAPPKIAADITAALAGNEELFTCECAGGYINLRATDSYLVSGVLQVAEAEGSAYGATDIGHGKTVVLDYSSPNTSKPFHIGHLGTTVIGHSLRLLHEFVGYKCIGINHLGDWGTQNGKQIVAFKRWGNREEVEKKGCDGLVELYVKFHEEAERDPSLNDEARAEFKKMEEGVPENIELWKWFLDISLKEYRVTYDQLGIEFDHYMGESFYTDKMPEQIARLRERDLLKIDDGASIVDLEEYNMPPCLILKKDGSTLYPTRDIAAAVYRKNTFAFDKCIYVTSAGQSLHFAQWFKVMELMGYDWVGELVHVPYGTVSIGGEKLATRTGNVVLLKNLFAQAVEKVDALIEEKNPDLEDRAAVAEAVGVGAVVFHYLYNTRMKDISFVMENALSFEGATGPYAQYTYARTCSILDKAGECSACGGGITADEERDVIKALAHFPERVLQALEDYEPSVITRYIIELAVAFNRFYHNCPINSAEDESVKAFRLRLTKKVGETLKTALGLICIKAPRKI